MAAATPDDNELDLILGEQTEQRVEVGTFASEPFFRRDEGPQRIAGVSSVAGSVGRR
jgi:hypothetical protein